MVKITSKKINPPTKAELKERRDKAHGDHLEYFYGAGWCVYIDKENKYFLEFDAGHFASEFIVREISKDDYESLKKDKSLYIQISRKVAKNDK